MTELLMSAGAVIVAIVLFAGAFGLRALPRLRGDPWLGTEFPLKGDPGDSMVHLIISDLIRKNKNRIINEAPQFLLGRHFDYPALFHKILSYFPKRTVERWDWTITPGIDALHILFVFVFTWYVLAAQTRTPYPLLLAAVAGAAFAITPLFTSSDRRATVGERPFGYLLGNIYLASLSVFLATGGAGWLLAAGIAATLGACSSKFTMQTIVLVTLAIALVTWDPRPIFILIACALFAVVASRGYVVRVTRGLIRHSTYYAHSLTHYQDYVRSFNDGMLISAAKDLLYGKPRQAWREIEKHPVRVIILRVPWLLPLLIVTIWGTEPTSDPTMGRVLLAWAWATVIVGLLTSLDAFKFLGEGFRYLEFGLLPIILTPLLLPPIWIAPVLLLALIPCAISVMNLWKHPIPFDRTSADSKELVDYFAALPPVTIAAVPGRVCFPLCYGTEHRAVWLLANIDTGERAREWQTLFVRSGVYPYPNPDVVAGLRHRFGTDVLVIWNYAAQQAERVWGRIYDCSAYPKLFENGTFIVYDLAAGDTRPDKEGQTIAATSP